MLILGQFPLIQKSVNAAEIAHSIAAE